MPFLNTATLVLICFLSNPVSGFLPRSGGFDPHTKQCSCLCMASSIQKVQVGDSTIQLRHQLFLSDVQSQTGADLTGLKYWPTASEPMLKVFQKQKHSSWFSDKPLSILELGSGCGLLGLGLASLNPNCRVILTDAPVEFQESKNENEQSSSSSTLDWLHSNVELNEELVQDRVSVEPLFWGDKDHLQCILHSHGSIDLVVGSELLYNNDASFGGLVNTLRYFSSSQEQPAKILLGYKRRNLGESQFFELANPYFQIETCRIGRKCDYVHLSELTLK